MHHFSLLQSELQQLRKGTGLTTWKLEQAQSVKEAIATRLQVSKESLALPQAYAYLLHEINELENTDGAAALQNAYRTKTSLSPTLTRRRTEFSLHIGRHPDTVKAYEDQAIEELTRRLLAPPVERPQQTPPTVTNTPSHEQALQRVVTESLAGLYQFGTHKEEIVRMLGKNPNPYLDANVECILSASKRGSNWYTYRYRYTFRSTKTTFRIAVTSSPHDTSALIASGLFDEMIQLNEGTDFDQELPGIITNCRFVIHDIKNNLQQSLWFAEMDAPSRRELLGSIWQIDADECRVIELQVMSANPSDATFYELRIDYDLRVDEHYAYWETPGLMYLNTLTLDISGFPERDKWQFFLKPFLGTAFTGSFDPSGNRFTLPANSWITAGQGIVAIWQEKK